MPGLRHEGACGAVVSCLFCSAAAAPAPAPAVVVVVVLVIVLVFVFVIVILLVHAHAHTYVLFCCLGLVLGLALAHSVLGLGNFCGADSSSRSRCDGVVACGCVILCLCAYTCIGVKDLAKAINNTEIAAITNLTAVPFGNAQYHPLTGKVQCQHGELECVGNSWEQCAIAHYPDTSDWFPFYYCIEANGEEGVTTLPTQKYA